jgi:hypothetical protein
VTLHEIAQGIAGPYGLAILVVLIAAGGMRGVWVWGREYDAMREDRNLWRELALSGTAIAGQALTLAERQAPDRNETRGQHVAGD